MARDILFLGNALATVHSKAELQGLLQNVIRRFVSFGHSALVLVDQTQTPFLITFADDKYNSPLLSEFLGLAPVNDAIYQLIASADNPTIVDLDKDIVKPNARNLFHALHAVGFRTMAAVALRHGEPVWGALLCFAPNKKRFTSADLLLLHGLSFPLATAVSNLMDPGGKAQNASRKGVPASHHESSHTKTLDENERDHILAVLEKCHGKISGKGGAANLLGVPATTLNSKMKRLGIKRGAAFDAPE
ncbi:GAF domain-containing protein [Chryseolinea lacunae]|uniref:GAF domain-containing protein n=1 Tax=Chryseolinea lacunae TaxID=2801331 RepID=UPI0034E2B828